ncbi:exopolysaccharide biosynthesis polyprenyl glycosylphosphotransferase [Methylobacterium brachythecii]|uniref:Undecaprenyl-phosphate galactose phosphotransferase WbaP n=1 Tax=Methylobacterium brachythecii TaxID=1176177 RepID=A0A7W6AIN8_9HYPH|nr:exopolysaccharide biosynthesis polyprenyl glycosylphosphotransferase [Methylobacterium brachythecii]MBB3903161.1 Undecaprenyl-phosphate galactose phosphotransferase WbaP [Methylobacterium brachythecii]GLS44742.1 undecaprenyl-phosphate galactose phosphotransferase WbaP [Methylobacterium brachythecii]
MSTTVAGPEVDASAVHALIQPERKAFDTAVTAGFVRRGKVIVVLLATDAAAATIAVVAGSTLTGGGPFGGLDVVALPILACLSFAAAGLYGGYGPSPAERLRLRTYCVLAVTAASLVFAAGLGATAGTVAGIALIGLLLLVLGFYAEVAARGFLIRRGLWGAKTAIVGMDACSLALADALLAQPELGLNPAGFVIGSEETFDSRAQAKLPILGSIEDAARHGDIEVAIVCSCVDLVLNDLARPGPLPFPRVVVAQQAPDLQSLWTQTRTLGSVLGLELRRDLYRRHNLRIKRCVDTLLTWPAFLLAAPLIAGLAIAIKFVDPGPAFYVQQRVGRNGKPIQVLKLRSMFIDAERRLQDHLAADAQARSEWQRFFKLSRDPRILPSIGNFIRRTSLDELPQLWNVVRGELSLVGPRPFPSYHTASFDTGFQALRQTVPPGLTGLWQVSSRSDGDLAVQKSQDSFYIRNWSIWLDFYILLATVPAVISGSGAR